MSLTISKLAHETSMAVNFFTQANDYFETPEGWNNNSPGFQSGVKKGSQIRFGGIFAQREQKS